MKQIFLYHQHMNSSSKLLHRPTVSLHKHLRACEWHPYMAISELQVSPKTTRFHWNTSGCEDASSPNLQRNRWNFWSFSTISIWLNVIEMSPVTAIRSSLQDVKHPNKEFEKFGPFSNASLRHTPWNREAESNTTLSLVDDLSGLSTILWLRYQTFSFLAYATSSGSKIRTNPRSIRLSISWVYSAAHFLTAASLFFPSVQTLVCNCLATHQDIRVSIAFELEHALRCWWLW